MKKELLKSIANYTNNDFKRICYYLMYIGKYDTKDNVLKIQKPKSAIRILYGIKKDIKVCWLNGYINDDEFDKYTDLMKILQMSIAHNYIYYVIVFICAIIRSHFINWWNYLVGILKKKTEKIRMAFSVLFGK